VSPSGTDAALSTQSRGVTPIGWICWPPKVGCRRNTYSASSMIFWKCGRLEHGFLHVRCQDCLVERLEACSGKRRGFCPRGGARRMVESAALLVDEVLPRLPMRPLTPGMACSRAMQEQLPRVLSFPFQLRFLFASRPEAMGRVLGIVYRAIETHLIQQAGGTRATARTGAVTLIQRFGSALNLNIHLMCMDARMPPSAGMRRSGPYAVSGRSVLDRRRATRVSPPPGAEPPGVGTTRPGDQSTGRSLAGTRGFSGAGYREQLPAARDSG